MARSLQQIMTELDPYYSSSKSAYQDQINALPSQQSAELAGLDASLQNANDNIVAQARSRGLGFSGIPVGEQAKYAATDYAPARANLQAKYVGQQNSLLDALSSLNRNQMTQAQGIYDNEASRDFQYAQLAEQKRQFDAQQAAAAKAAASGGYSLGGGYGAGTPRAAAAPASAGGGAKIQQIPGKGWSFTDANGRGISAYAYSQIKGTGFRALLSQLANAGDTNAKFALQLVGDDGYANPALLKSMPGAVVNGLRALGVRNA